MAFTAVTPQDSKVEAILIVRRGVTGEETKRSVCKVRTQDPENFDEEVKSLLTAWRILIHPYSRNLRAAMEGRKTMDSQESGDCGLTAV